MTEPNVEWRDLIALRRSEIVMELCMPLPWLALAWLSNELIVVVLASGVLFMTGLRVTHNAFHRSLGLSARAGDIVMFILSISLGGAMHAIEYTHLHHHRHCLHEDDVEGRIAHLAFAPALLQSVLYPLHIHSAALRNGNAHQRRWIAAEIVVVLVLHGLIWCVMEDPALKAMAVSLYAANASAAMVGIWAVHRGCAQTAQIARTSRSRRIDRLVVNMFFHWEHHLFPAVPTCHLPELARRIDARMEKPVLLRVIGRAE